MLYIESILAFFKTNRSKITIDVILRQYTKIYQPCIYYSFEKAIGGIND